MKLLALPLLLLCAAPANALTWKEFWEPFEGDRHYHYHGSHIHRDYYRPRRPMCEVQVTRRVWIPGHWLGHHEYVEGYWEKQTRLKWRPCRH